MTSSGKLNRYVYVCSDTSSLALKAEAAAICAYRTAKHLADRQCGRLRASDPVNDYRCSITEQVERMFSESRMRTGVDYHFVLVCGSDAADGLSAFRGAFRRRCGSYGASMRVINVTEEARLYHARASYESVLDRAAPQLLREMCGGDGQTWQRKFIGACVGCVNTTVRTKKSKLPVLVLSGQNGIGKSCSLSLLAHAVDQRLSDLAKSAETCDLDNKVWHRFTELHTVSMITDGNDNTDGVQNVELLFNNIVGYVQRFSKKPAKSRARLLIVAIDDVDAVNCTPTLAKSLWTRLSTFVASQYADDAHNPLRVVCTVITNNWFTHASMVDSLRRKSSALAALLDIVHLPVPSPSAYQIEQHLSRVFANSNADMCRVISEQANGDVRAAMLRMEFSSHCAVHANGNIGTERGAILEKQSRAAFLQTLTRKRARSLAAPHPSAAPSTVSDEFYKDVDARIGSTLNDAELSATLLHENYPRMLASASAREPDTCEQLNAAAALCDMQSLADVLQVQSREKGFRGADGVGTDRQLFTALAVSAPMTAVAGALGNRPASYMKMAFEDQRHRSKSRTLARDLRDIDCSRELCARRSIGDDPRVRLIHSERTSKQASRQYTVDVSTLENLSALGAHDHLVVSDPADGDNESLTRAATRALMSGLSSDEFCTAAHYVDTLSHAVNSSNDMQTTVCSLPTLRKAFAQAEHQIKDLSSASDGTQQRVERVDANRTEPMRLTAKGKFRAPAASKSAPTAAAKRRRKNAVSDTVSGDNSIVKTNKKSPKTARRKTVRSMLV